MKKATPAAEQFAVLGVSKSDYTDAMKLAIRQKWTNLPVDVPVAELRTRLAAVTPAPVPSLEEVTVAIAAAHPDLPVEDVADKARTEQARLKRNAAVHAWRQRNQLQAALDARDHKFKVLRAKAAEAKAARGGLVSA